MHQKFYHPHYTREIWKCNNCQPFWIGVCGKLGQGNHISLRHYCFQKALFSKCFLSTLKHKAGIFKFLWFEEHFVKLRFLDGLVWIVVLTMEIKLRYLISPAYRWWGPGLKNFVSYSQIQNYMFIVKRKSLQNYVKI